MYIEALICKQYILHTFSAYSAVVKENFQMFKNVIFMNKHAEMQDTPKICLRYVLESWWTHRKRE